MFMILLSSGSYNPAREAQYNQIWGEASLGLVSAPRCSLFLTLVDDVLKTSLTILIIFALHSIWWNKDILSWPTPSIWSLMTAMLCLSFHINVLFGGSLFAGAPLYSVKRAQLIDTLLTFYIAGVFNPITGLLPGNRFGYLSLVAASSYLCTGAAFAPGVSLHFGRAHACISLGIWLCIDVALCTCPLWSHSVVHKIRRRKLGV